MENDCLYLGIPSGLDLKLPLEKKVESYSLTHVVLSGRYPSWVDPVNAQVLGPFWTGPGGLYPPDLWTHSILRPSERGPVGLLPLDSTCVGRPGHSYAGASSINHAICLQLSWPGAGRKPRHGGSPNQDPWGSKVPRGRMYLVLAVPAITSLKQNPGLSHYLSLWMGTRVGWYWVAGRYSSWENSY